MKLKSVAVLKAAVIVCAVLSIGVAVAAPWIVDWYARIRPLEPIMSTTLLICYYICMIPTLIALYSMLRVLIHIQKKHPFEHVALKYLGIISWCCLAVAVVCAGGAYWYLPLAFISAAMVFLFLTVRVVNSCFLVGTMLQEENDLTV